MGVQDQAPQPLSSALPATPMFSTLLPRCYPRYLPVLVGGEGQGAPRPPRMRSLCTFAFTRCL